MKSGRQSGFTLIELMIVVAIIGILAAVAVPYFMGYVKKSKTAEARELVRKMYDGARTYYMDANARATSMAGATLPPMFPEPSMAATPALGTCCATGSKCQPSTSYWTGPTWTALVFSVAEPHYYMYAYKVVGNAGPGEAASIDGSNRFTALGYGDLDCDGEYSTFSAFGQVDAAYSEGPSGISTVNRVRELE